MSESQTIEYKESWHDEYLKCICGFANAQGGTLYVGKDDQGCTVGVANAKKLMEDIPNKIKDTMGISANVITKEENGKHIIAISIEAYTSPISLRGKHYRRVGSITRELTGSDLNEFLLKKSGKTWDEVLEPRATFDDIDEEAVKVYIADAQKAGRLPDISGIFIADLFEKLRLTENGKLKRAAIVLFGKDPAKFYSNTAVKLGRFGSNDADLKFQETEEGNLITILGAILQQLNSKFITKQIRFEGIHRVEEGEYPTAAMRELLLNALVHRNYMGSHTQISIYDNKLSCWNDGLLPDGLDLEALKRKHASKPRNPLIADVCYKGGYIDTWGRGTLTIIDACKAAKLPEPELKEQDGGFMVTLFNNNTTIKTQPIQHELNERQTKALLYVKEYGQITNKEYQSLNSCSRNTASRDLAELVSVGLLASNDIKGAGALYTPTK